MVPCTEGNPVTETPTPPKPLMFELCYRREAYRVERGHYIRTPEKDKDLPDRPVGFRPLTGSFTDVANRADQLNDLQTRSGFLFYFYWAEPIPSKSNPDHCDACRRAQKLREPAEPDQ